MLSEIIDIYFLVTPGVRIWDKNGRQTEVRKLSECRGTRPGYDEIRGGERSTHLLM